METSLEIQNLLQPLTIEEYAGLRHSLIHEGCLDPLRLGVLPGEEPVLIDGHNRLALCKELHIEYETMELEFDTLEEMKIWVLKNQMARRNLSAGQRAVYVLQIKPEIQEQAKEKQVRKPANSVLMNSSKQKPISTRKVLSEIAGVSEDTVQKAMYIEEHDASKIEEVLQGESIHKVYTELKKEEKKEAFQADIEKQREEIKNGTAKLPEGKYEIIVIDPPWGYGTAYDPYTRRAGSPYPEMTQEQLKEIELPATEDCILWLWTTHLYMRDALELVEHWGFREVSILTWDKGNIGLGSWLRSQSEFCIMCVKGKPKVSLSNQSTVLQAPRGKHSEKPQEFYEMVESLCVGRMLDYYARKNRGGWDTYGIMEQ